MALWYGNLTCSVFDSSYEPFIIRKHVRIKERSIRTVPDFVNICRLRPVHHPTCAKTTGNIGIRARNPITSFFTVAARPSLDDSTSTEIANAATEMVGHLLLERARTFIFRAGCMFMWIPNPQRLTQLEGLTGRRHLYSGI